jgi:acyl-CoA thioesterase I
MKFFCTLTGVLQQSAALAMLAVSLSGIPAAQAETANDQDIVIVALGDSLTAGYMLAPDEAFPVQLQMALAAKGHKVQVVNAGVSGDTSAGGAQRLDWSLQGGADAVIVELGANDALRGIDPALTKAALDKIITAIKAKGADVLIAGMKAPGNWGPEYQKAFDALYPELAQKHGVALYPFFLDGVALDPKLVLTDGLHPSAQGVAQIVKRILPATEALIAKVEARKASNKN